MKQTIKHIVMGSLVFALVLTPAAVFAQESDEDTGSNTTTSDTSTLEERRLEAKRKLQARLEQAREDRADRVETAKSNLRERLSEAKKKVCERHQSKINQIMEKMDNRRTKAFDRITQIHEAVTAFYGEKGLSVANYDELVASVVAAKEVAQTRVGEQKAVPELNCDSETPRADVSEFREKRLDSIDAMKAYRDAVKNLAQAIKEAAIAAKTADTEGES